MPTFHPFLQIALPEFEAYVLVLVRVGFLFAVAPVFGSQTIPTAVKAAVVAVFALAVYPAAVPAQIRPFPSLWSMVPAVAGEAAVGLMVGAAARMIFFGIQFAGQVIGFQMGFLVASAIDPQEGRHTSLVAQFQEILALLLFLALDGHHWVLKGLAGSYRWVPALSASWSGAAAATFVEFTGQVFWVALKVAAPVTVALLMTNLGLGILARTVPQMNVFVVSFPLTISVGFLVLALSLQVVNLLLEGRFQAIGDEIVRLLAGFR
ncbi:MAG: flagellar biosynthetic protein FliR [Candidatus Tectomicrobia bacterium]|nr:flagellar biosynthetic protein FliR [Candidatus Tectomicrobia bacterium]